MQEETNELAQLAMELEESEATEASPLTVEQLDKLLHEMRELDSDYKAKKKISNEAHAKLETKKMEMLNILEALDRKSYVLPGVGAASSVTENSYKMPASLADREALFQYIAKTYNKELLYTMTSIHHDTLNNFIKQELAQDRKVPGISSPTTSTYVKFLKK